MSSISYTVIHHSNQSLAVIAVVVYVWMHLYPYAYASTSVSLHTYMSLRTCICMYPCIGICEHVIPHPAPTPSSPHLNNLLYKVPKKIEVLRQELHSAVGRMHVEKRVANAAVGEEGEAEGRTRSLL